MEWTSIVTAFISALSAVAVAVIAGKMKKTSDNIDKKTERRAKESLLSLTMMSATMELSMACCNALTGGHNNGNVEEAKRKAQAAETAYKEFERTIVAEELA